MERCRSLDLNSLFLKVEQKYRKNIYKERERERNRERERDEKNL